MFIFDDPLAQLELHLTAAILLGGLNGVVFGDTLELLVGSGMVVAIVEVIRVEEAGYGISSLLILALLSFVFIRSCPEKDGRTPAI